ncbi:rhodanese-like domain-containing protein [Leptospira sp. GIMC2001]|uniref:rhodanese-like domain-containing protein n=1 Tax=Leptospira sp. GIMC2001 TaxID=1513297 RepID=UPI00234BBDB7|nr:rhodanese-like domain-containing protein [Leptospira sp. GIMC2001]WCL48775.1 rhodanese-like domain-containing protein [Leptospira sp. GIMC2001]
MNWNFLTQEIKDNDFLIDCRTLNAYEEETLVGAYYYSFIKKAFGSDPESYKKLASPVHAVMAEIQSSGSNRVVVFDEGMGMYAARMLFFIRSMGFKEAYLYGGKWPIEGKKSQGQKKIEPPIEDKLKPVEGVVDKAFMEKNLTRLQIFDTRTKEEYDGKIPRLTSPEEGTLCGRLPGSFLWDWRNLFDNDGMIIDKSIFRRRMNGFPFMPERPTVLYDYNGARSCLLALMLREFGYQEVYTYQGSWFEYRKSNLPKQATSIFGAKNPTPAPPRVGGMDKKKI